MLDKQQSASDANASRLVGDLFAGSYSLALQQYALLRYELAAILSAYRDAARLIACGAFAITLGCLFAGFMAVYLLSWIFPRLPLWACFGSVAAPYAAAGAGLLYWGIGKLKVVYTLCGQSQESLKETLTWATKLRSHANS